MYCHCSYTNSYMFVMDLCFIFLVCRILSLNFLVWGISRFENAMGYGDVFFLVCRI